MIPLFIAAGAVMLTASAVAWLYDKKTEEEKSRQNNAYKERDNYRSDFNSKSQNEKQGFSEEQKKQASKYKSLMLTEIKQLSKKIAPISDAIDQLFQVIQLEMNAETTSPYRRSALLREYSRTQDAKTRLDEYGIYLNFEKQRVDRLWKQQQFTKLMKLELADALLPLEWLYEGKLVLADLTDIGKPLPNFKHRLIFSGNREQQQALAVSYGDDFPVLVVRKGERNDGAFFGCVAKGICFHDHIRANEPVEMRVERYLPKDKAYHGTLFGNMVHVQLPEMNLLHPSLRCINGQSVPVYFDAYDSILKSNPSRKCNFKGRVPSPSVSAKPPAFIGQDELEIYIETEEQQLNSITDDQFYDDHNQWTLLDNDIGTKEITLGKATVRVQCIPSSDLDGLCVTKISQCLTAQVGVDLPFDFILASKSLGPSKYFSWPYGLEQMYTFASQALINSDTVQQRIKQVEFFKRWQRVIEYQKKMESERGVEFDFTPELLERHNYRLLITQSQIQQAAVDDRSIITLVKEIENSGYLSFAYSCRLMVWDKERGDYLPAIDKHRVNQTVFSVTKAGALEIRTPLIEKFNNISFNKEQKFKLLISLPNAALQRQQQALNALFEDRMVEPALKDIFLSPGSYQPQHLGQWQKQDIIWKDNLTESQKEVVTKALSAKHIAMVQGPPGTGKTTTIVEMLYQLISHNPKQRILVVSQQNTAVDNAINKFKKKYPQLIAESVGIVRVGNPDKIDAGMGENHFDKVYEDFLADQSRYINSKIQTMDSEAKRSASYQWAALLREMEAKVGSKKVSDEFFSLMLSDKNLIGATCVGLAGRKAGVDHLYFDLAIVDEAGRATVPELLIPLLRSKKAILIGDHHQLPPSIAPVLRDDSAIKEMGFLKETFLENSFFEVLFDQLPPACTASLKEQFRMSPPIGDLVADLFYTKNGQRQLFNGAGDKFDNSAYAVKDCLVWHDVIGKQKRPKNSTSIENIEEAIVITDFLQNIARKQTTLIDVAVITPYGAQKRRIRQMLCKGGAGSNLIKLGKLSIKVDTVDSFQGSEAELVCYSTVRTFGSLEFLLDKKRLNVACSRAKQSLVFFGHSQHLKKWIPKKDEINLFVEILGRAKFVKTTRNNSELNQSNKFQSKERI